MITYTYHVPDSDLTIAFLEFEGSQADTNELTVFIENEANGTYVRMTMNEWARLVTRGRYARGLAIREE